MQWELLLVVLLEFQVLSIFEFNNCKYFESEKRICHNGKCGNEQKQIKVLITGESLLYSVYAALLGLVCSLVSGFLLIGPICKDTWFMHFDMVIWPAILIGGNIVILTIFLPKLLYKVFSKGSIVENLELRDRIFKFIKYKITWKGGERV